jgi:hypothetical protein
MALELKSDCHLDNGVRARFQRDIDDGPNGSIHSPDPTDAVDRTSRVQRCRVGQRGRYAGWRGTVPELGNADAVHMTADDTLLPFRIRLAPVT